ncbi:MAG TPA: thioredoxin-dependent thiol peroxidase [Dongiaceae bacterium]|jgi:peroxiredoxin Q/BCP|nr:thioredoxin-dependent thiol peroxidase [Dongiaceae bacterium]
MTLAPGDKAPDFSLPGDDGSTLTLGQFKGKNLVLYFYPKDDTSGCTKQACAFRDTMASLKRKGTAIIGVSRDSLGSHKKFRAKYDLNFPLGADEDGRVTSTYGVWVEKSMYGRKYMGIERSTFLIDGKGIVRAVWRKVKVHGHVDEVMAALAELG